MRNLLIIISLLVSFPAFSQRLEWSKIYLSNKGSAYLSALFCDTGCNANGLFYPNNNGQYTHYLFQFSTNGFVDSGVISMGYFFGFPQLLNKNNKYSYLRNAEILSSNRPNFIYGRTIISKWDNRTNRKLWDNFTLGTGADYHGNYQMATLQEDPTCFTYISTRNNYPFTGAAEHPFIQEFDSSGNLLWEQDFLNWPNIHSFAGGAFKYPDNGVFIYQIQRVPTVIQPVGSDTLKMFGIWYDKPTRTIFKRKFLPRYLQYHPYGDYKITPIKGDKYLINIKFQNVAWSPDLIQTYLTDSSLSLQSAFWVKNNYQIDQAIALEDGNILTQKLISTNGRIRIEKLNALTGDTIWSRTITPPNIPNLGSFSSDPLCRIDDSGSVYCSIPADVRGMWLFKISGIGKQWDPWNPNPNGTGETRKKFTFYPYPNPSTGRLRLRGLKETEGVSLRLFNNQGREVWKGSLSMEGEIDISNLPIGLYHLEALNAQGQRWSTRVVRE